MQKISKDIFLWAFGGTIYYFIEIMYRGYSHWSMFILGGICFLFCGYQRKIPQSKVSLVNKILNCMIFVSSSEFITGILFNKILRCEVWDYSEVPFNIMGQICLPYAVLFGLLSIIGMYVFNVVEQNLYLNFQMKI